MRARIGPRSHRQTIAMCGFSALLLLAFSPACSQAQTESRKHVRVVPTEEQALHDLLVKAKKEADANDYATAQADYEKYLAQKPDDASAHFDLGYVYTAQQATDKAIAEYRKAIALAPAMIQAHLNLGMSLLERNPKEAIAPLEKVVEMNYAFEKGHYALGFAEERSGDEAAAEKEYTVAVKLDPNDIDAHSALGRTLLSEKKAAAAEAEFREALRLKSGDPPAEIGLAQSLMLENKREDAVAELQNYLKTHPNDRGVLLTEASLLAGMNKNDDALAALDEAAKLAPESLDALKLRSEIYFTQKNWPTAATALEKAEKVAPQDATIHARLGHVLLESRDYAGGARELAESLRLDASSAETMRDLVSAEYLAKNYQGALVALDLLAKHETPNAGAWFVRGSCYDHLNQPQAALDAYNKFLAMNTDTNSNEYFEAAARARFLQKLIKQKGH